MSEIKWRQSEVRWLLLEKIWTSVSVQIPAPREEEKKNKKQAADWPRKLNKLTKIDAGWFLLALFDWIKLNSLWKWIELN